MPAWMRKIFARSILVFLYLSQLTRRFLPRWRAPDGLERFLAQYVADGVVAIPADERQAFPSYQRCQACSLCTLSCRAIQEGRAPSSFEPKYLLLGLGRSSHESEYFLEEWLPCLECQDCTVTCPNQVPVHAMASRIRERRNRVGFRQGFARAPGP